MKEFKISSQQAKQFAFDCYDEIIRKIRENAEKTAESDSEDLNDCA